MAARIKSEVVYVHGSYYGENFGDYVLIKRTVDLVKDIVPSATVKLPLIPRKHMRLYPTLERGLGRVWRAKCAVFTGGGYLGEPPGQYWAWSIRCAIRHCVLALILRWFSVPYFFFGVGAGPITWRPLRFLVRKVLEGAQIVVVRDQESFDFCRELLGSEKNLRLGTDLAQNKQYIDSLMNFPISKEMSGRYIIVHCSKDGFGEWSPCVERSLKEAIKHGFKIIFLSDSPAHNNVWSKPTWPFYNFLNTHLSKCEVRPFKSAGEVISTLYLGAAVVTSKLHVGIVAATIEVPILSIPDHHKTKRYYKHILRPELCLDNICGEELKEQAIECFFQKVFINKSSVSLPAKVLSKERSSRGLLARFLLVKQ